ncbi:hypothetical protein FQN60_010628 [Etheostoma spectabile]|uniref:Uncharacterized protein n=1 Tax=Etheostoma spectabile TaxID=54343 RepID=A0A5J5CC43_9PERO|nr:hypothetical protein FQN60_010628 [Etheostoma spectabile]
MIFTHVAHVNATVVSVPAPRTTTTTFTAGATALLLLTPSPSSITVEESKVPLYVLLGGWLVVCSAVVIAISIISSSRSTVWSSSAGLRPLCTPTVQVRYAFIPTGPALPTSRFDISRYSDDSDWKNFKLRPLGQVPPLSCGPQTDPFPPYWTVCSYKICNSNQAV